MELERAIQKVESAIDSAITPAHIYIDPVLEAARLVANPLDGLWFCESHGYAIDRFDGLTPKECLYVGRPGPCKPIAALIVAAALTPGTTNE